MRIAVIAAVANLFFIGLAGVSLWQSRSRYEERAEIVTRNLALALAGQIANSIDKIDLTVFTVAEEVEKQLAGGGIDARTLNAFISRHHARLGDLDGLCAVNAPGEILYGIGVNPDVRTSVADRDNYIRLRDDPNAGLLITGPVAGRVSGRWEIHFARRVNQPDGSFAGLVYGTMGLEHFLATFSRVDVGRHGALTLRDGQLALIVRYPEPKNISDIIGTKNATPELQRAVQLQKDAGTYRSVRVFDKIPRTYSYHQVAGSAFYIIVGAAPEDYLAAWRSEAAGLSALVGVFLLGTLLASRMVYRGTMRRNAAIQALEQATARAESANRAKSEFLAMMSHELRTPLNGVLGFADLLWNTPLTNEQAEHVRTIQNSSNHLLDIVNDILDFFSIEKGAMRLESAPICLSDLVETSCQAIRKTAADKGLELRCETAPGVPDQITGDARRIRQILINLLGNAVKFTSEGSVVLRLAPTAEAGRGFLNFSVEDTGPGIPFETLARLFKPFTQADSTRSRAFGGAGLGLAVSQRLAEAMGGSITVSSTPGKGSTFTFHFPLASPPPTAGTGVPPVGMQDSSTGTVAPHTDVPPGNLPFESGPKSAASGVEEKFPATETPGNLVLVVEDDKSSSFLAGKMLQSLGCRVEFADNGAEAVAVFAPGKFSAILMDVRMPVMDGLVATRKIREVEAAAGGHVPIIALTANVMTGHREICLAAGMDDFLTKPFKRNALAAKLPGVGGP